MSETLFTKIIAGKVPCHRIYEDEQTFAFLDIEPLAPGHTLLVPKEPAATLDALSDAAAAALGRALPRLCRAIMVATRSDAYNVLQNNGSKAGQSVHHVHFHIVPRLSPSQGLQVMWRPVPEQPDALPDVADRITAALQTTATAPRPGAPAGSAG
jgi:histidine triad (HIT) family protein